MVRRTTIDCRCQELESIFIFASRIYEVCGRLRVSTGFDVNHSRIFLEINESAVFVHIYDGVSMFALCLAVVIHPGATRWRVEQQRASCQGDVVKVVCW